MALRLPRSVPLVELARQRVTAITLARAPATIPGGGVVQIAAAHQPRRCTGLLHTNAVAYDSWPVLRSECCNGPRRDRAGCPPRPCSQTVRSP